MFCSPALFFRFKQFMRKFHLFEESTRVFRAGFAFFRLRARFRLDFAANHAHQFNCARETDFHENIKERLAVCIAAGITAPAVWRAYGLLTGIAAIRILFQTAGIHQRFVHRAGFRLNQEIRIVKFSGPTEKVGKDHGRRLFPAVQHDLFSITDSGFHPKFLFRFIFHLINRRWTAYYF